MSFDLDRCLKEDEGKCLIFGEDGSFCEGTVVYNQWRSSDSNKELKLLVVLHGSNSDDFLIFDINGRRTYGQGNRLKNIPKTIKKKVFLARYKHYPSGNPFILPAENYIRDSGCEIIAAKEIEFTEGEGIDLHPAKDE